MVLNLPGQAEVIEVGPRDGLQNEKTLLDLPSKVRLVSTLSRCGFRKIEVGSFVHPDLVPQMADTDRVFEVIERHPSVGYVGLVANARGAQRAARAGVDEVNFVIAASETFNQQNVRKSVARSLAELGEVAGFCKSQGISVWCSVATAFGCPFEGHVPEQRVLALVESALSLGVAGITLADTTGMANPVQVANLVSSVKRCASGLPLALHFHNTRGMGVANILAGLQAGCMSFDASIGGLGGCPFAPGATGNVCTEDVVHMLEEMGVQTGIDLDILIAVARDLESMVGHPLPGQVMKAGKRSQLQRVPSASGR
ncbi:MAG: hydroxymethylglutaryl-CoA lyase [Bacillota bacterium]|nr:hydroxymethylglutaryl-CoA lyase [Bacillota bacterium]